MHETDESLWNCSEEGGNIRSVRKMKALTVEMEKMTLTGKSR
jgi:hypothetical protein